MLLLRFRAGFCKLTYSARVTPPALHAEALVEFGLVLRNGLEAITEGELSDSAWKQAQLSIINGGLGIRDVRRHASAAFVASVWSCQHLCKALDPNYNIDQGGGDVPAAVTELQSSCMDTANLNPACSPMTQKHLSSLIDGALKAELRADVRNKGAHLAHLNLVTLPGAGACLTAPPVEDGRDFDPDLFRIALKRRLRIQISVRDSYCPCCGDLFDSFGDHALVCQCKGDRTVRHNSIRNIVYEEAVRAGTGAEKEKAGLLPPRPQEDGVGEVDGDRRPADVWLPRLQGASGEALDFACTSGMRGDFLLRSREDGSAVFPLYEDYKRHHKNTDEHCKQAGFKFTPFVLEAHGGGWSPLARAVVDKIAKAQSAAWQEGQEPSSLRIAQRISCSLQRENARAVLRRLIPPAAVQGVAGWGGAEAEEVM